MLSNTQKEDILRAIVVTVLYSDIKEGNSLMDIKNLCDDIAKNVYDIIENKK